MKNKMEEAGYLEDKDDDILSESGNSNEDGDEDLDEQDTDGLDEEDDGDLEEQDGEMSENLKRKISEEDGEPAKAAKIEDEDGRLYRLPTVDELTRLRETQTLYHSNLFRIQMEELLLEGSMKTKHRYQLTQWLNQFATYIKALPPSPTYQLGVTKWMKEKNIIDPLSLPEGKGSFQFMAPTDVKFVGSFAAGTAVTTEEAIDVMLVLPKEIVKFKDYKEGRWLAKRSKYLSWLAIHLREKSDIVTSVNWTTHLGNASRPMLQVTPSGGVGKKWKINLLPVPCSESMKLLHFSPEKWTVTPSWYYGEEGVKEEELKATPHCNWSSAVDVVMQDHLQLINDSISQHSNLSQGIKLLKIWLAQRGLNKGSCKISGHVVTMLIIHLLQMRKINSQMSGYQVFRTVIITLDSCDWSTKGMCMKGDMSDDLPTLETLHNLYEVVFMDPSGRVNLATNLMSEDFRIIKHEVALALHILDSSTADSFEFLFMKKVEFFQVCDQIVSLKLKKKDLKSILETNKYAKHQTMDNLGDLRYPAWSLLLKTLKRGLGDRVRVLVPKKEATSLWPVEESPPKLKSSLAVGFVINETAAKALLTKGPSADDPEGLDFRSFWGEKSNLRRFQDGSFHEAVLWGDVKQSVGDRRLIPGSVAKYVLNFHYGLKEDDVHFICNETESILRLKHCTMPYEYGTGEEATVQAIQAYDSFTRKLRSLELPLKVTSVQSTSDVCRHTRVFPPLSKALGSGGKGLQTEEYRLQFTKTMGFIPFYNHVLEVNVFLETSGKWPDDLVAIQAIKAEFYKTMASLMVAESVTAFALPKFLQVLWEGYIFHVKVCYRKEIYLSRLVENSEGVLREEDTDAAINLEKDLEIMPRINTALASVQADHPSFNCGVRLAKRWVGSQLLLPHIPHMVIEFLMAYISMNSAPYDAPHTPHVLFLRFLALLAHTDWKTTPILVNLRDTFTVEDVTELHRRFTSERSSLPDMFIATPYELRGLSTTVDTDYRYKLTSLWTKESPSLPIIYRCRQLASASLDFMTNNMLKTTLDIKTIFRPSLEDFDVVIRLHTTQLSRHLESLDFQVKKPKQIQPYKYQSNEVMPIVMFDAAQLYLRELRAAFDHIALFFHDEHGGNVIGVVWKPSALQEQNFKIGSLEAHRVIGIKVVKQVSNMEAILSDFEVIGSDLVESVIVNEKTT